MVVVDVVAGVVCPEVGEVVGFVAGQPVVVVCDCRPDSEAIDSAVLPLVLNWLGAGPRLDQQWAAPATFAACSTDEHEAGPIAT